MASPSDAADPGHASDPFRVPDTFARGGGPVAGNPFLSDDPLHRVWADRTRKAEETINRLTAEWLSTNEPYTAARAATLIIAKFDAWAERAVSIVWCDRALQHCDEWLVAEANAWIEGVTRTYAETTPPFSVKTLLMDLRRRLGAQVYVWKAAARRVCADYQAAMSNPSAEPPGSSEHVLGANPYREDDPNYQEWTTTNQMLANGLARIHAAFFAVLPRHRDAATIGDWLAIWTVTYFDGRPGRGGRSGCLRGGPRGVPCAGLGCAQPAARRVGPSDGRVDERVPGCEGVQHRVCALGRGRAASGVAGSDTAPGGALRRVAGAGVRLGSCGGAAGTAGRPHGSTIRRGHGDGIDHRTADRTAGRFSDGIGGTVAA
jgi:hypothetical protein